MVYCGTQDSVDQWEYQNVHVLHLLEVVWYARGCNTTAVKVLIPLVQLQYVQVVLIHCVCSANKQMYHTNYLVRAAYVRVRVRMIHVSLHVTHVSSGTQLRYWHV